MYSDLLKISPIDTTLRRSLIRGALPYRFINLFSGFGKQIVHRGGQIPTDGFFVRAFFVFALTVFYRAAADYQAVRQADKVHVFKFYARAFVSVIEQDG